MVIVDKPTYKLMADWRPPGPDGEAWLVVTVFRYKGTTWESKEFGLSPAALKELCKIARKGPPPVAQKAIGEANNG